MIVEEGKYYRAENGKKIGPMAWWEFERDCFRSLEYGRGGLWNTDGSPRFAGKKDSPRLIAEWTDEPDLTAITTPYGLLDEATQAALKAHGGPYEFCNASTEWEWTTVVPPCAWHPPNVYRAKPGSSVKVAPAPQPEPLADRLQRILTDGLKTANNEGATLLAALDLWAAERGVTIKEE